MSRETLRQIATMAKERMKRGYWKESAEGCARLVQSPQDVHFSKISEDEETFREKVRQIVESGEEILDPILRLVDRERYERADCAGRQKMILETSARYRRVRRELERT